MSRGQVCGDVTPFVIWYLFELKSFTLSVRLPKRRAKAKLMAWRRSFVPIFLTMWSRVRLAEEINPKGLEEETHSHRNFLWKYPHSRLKLTLCSIIRVKLLSQREPGPTLSISTHHLRMVLISETRPQSFCRGVRLFQNDLSTSSSPCRTLIIAAHFPLLCCHSYGLAKTSGIKRALEFSEDSSPHFTFVM